MKLSAKISVAKNKVSIKTKINWAVIEINTPGNQKTFALNKLLPDTFHYAKGKDKILIINFGNNTSDISDLFIYTGTFNPQSINIYDFEKNVYYATILHSRERFKDIHTTFANLKSNIFSNMDFNGDNRFKKIETLVQDRDSRKLIKKTIYKKTSNTLPTDRLNNQITGLKADNLIDEKGNFYSGEHYYDVNSKKIYKGSPKTKNKQILTKKVVKKGIKNYD